MMVCVTGRSSTTHAGLLLLLVLMLAACGAGDDSSGVAVPGAALAQSGAAADACGEAMAVEAWQGTISYSHARDVEGSNPDHVVYSEDVNVTARLEESYRNENAVGFVATELSGTIDYSVEEHTHNDSEHQVDLALAGEGPPLQGSRMTFSVFPDCRYDFYFVGNVQVTGTAGGEPTEGPQGVNPLKGEFEGSGLTLSGTFDFPVYHPAEIEASVDKPIWFAERYDVADALSDELGTVSVTWSFVPAD